MFQDTLNKQIIRSQWDRPILQKLATASQSKLTYFGMPGPQIKDFTDWDDLLSYKTAVQIVRSGKQKDEDLETINKMLTNVMVKNVTPFQLLRGPMEEVVLQGHDMDGTFPNHAFKDAKGNLCFKYDFVNLDFEGGAGYKAKKGRARDNSGGRRIESIGKLFDRQQGHTFILFWTVNVRDTLGDEPLQYLQECAQRIQNPTVQEVVRWTVGLTEGGLKHYQLKTWIPLFIKEEAEVRKFHCYCYPPVVYEGFERAKMVHFAFFLEYEKDRMLRVASTQSEERVVRLPMMEASDAQLKISERQCPMFDESSCEAELEFLDEDVRRAVMGTLVRPAVTA